MAPNKKMLTGGALRAARPTFAAKAAGQNAVAAMFIAPTVVLLLLVAGFPLAYNVYVSLQHFVLTEPGTEHFVGVQNYVRFITSQTFIAALRRTVVFAIVSVALEFSIGLALALVMHRDYRGRGLVRAAILVPWAVPTVVSGIVWKTSFDPTSGFVDFILGALHLPGAQTAWLNGIWTAWTVILVADAWKTTPFLAIILLAGLQVIPDELHEAAEIDGAGPVRRFLYITVPLLKPAILVALVFRTLSALLIFDVIYVITGGGPGDATETLSYINWKAFLVDMDFGYGGAVSVFLILFSLLVALAYMRVLRPST
jgi:multiple sugar transport system permease protein